MHLVRHGRPGIRPGQPAHEWQLDLDAAAPGLHALRDSGALPSDALWWSSDEPKALDTAAALATRGVKADARLREQLRSAVWFDDPDEFEAVVRAVFAEPERSAAEGWEPMAHTTSRVVPALLELTATAHPRPVVVVGHGTAWTIAVAALTGTRPDLDGWSSMTMPDHCSLDLAARRVVAPWGAWRRR